MGAARLLPALLLLALPFLSLVAQTQWGALAPAYGDWHAVQVSLTLSVWAMIVIFITGTPVSIWLARTRSSWKQPVDILVLFSLLTPSLATGILLVSAYGPYGPAGQMLAHVGVSLNNNAGAFVLAQVYGGLAYFIIATRTAFENVPRVLEEAAQDLGSSPWKTFYFVTFPVAAREITVGAMVTWVRIIGEFGIVAVFSYFPQGIPVKLFVNLQNDGVQSVYVLVWILMLLTLPFPLLIMSVFKQRR
jgi:molybdate/tungstate transport system permease protein